jgi:hypothetical protein
MNNMQDIPTKELVAELITRDGVDFQTVGAYEQCDLTFIGAEINALFPKIDSIGPFILIKVTD